MPVPVQESLLLHLSTYTCQAAPHPHRSRLQPVLYTWMELNSELRIAIHNTYLIYFFSENCK